MWDILPTVRLVMRPNFMTSLSASTARIVSTRAGRDRGWKRGVWGIWMGRMLVWFDVLMFFSFLFFFSVLWAIGVSGCEF